jgi:hypothetical protein
MMRRVLIAIVFPIAFAHAWAVAFTGCGALTPADDAHVAMDSIQMGTCAASAHLCKRALEPDASTATCWAEYDDCMTAHGFADASVDAGKERGR